MSWPYSPNECPHCRYLHPLEPPAFDDAGFEIVGFCLHPRIGMDLFRFQRRDPTTMDLCPCFRRIPPDKSG